MSPALHPHPRSIGATTRDDGWTLRWFVTLLPIVLLTELAAFSFNLISTALPGIGAHFHTAQLGWTISVTNLAGGLLYPVTGRLGDLYGKRRILLWLTAGGVVGAVLSAVAADYPLFLLGRVLQGLLLPTLPLAYSLIRDVFPPRIMATAASLTVTGFGATFVASPFLAGWLIDSFDYRGVFWFLAVYPAVCLVLIAALVPESAVRAQRRLDYAAAALLGLSAPAILLGLSEGPAWHWTSPATLGCIAGGLILLVLWYRRDTTVDQPLVNVRLIKSRPMWTTLLASGLIYGAAAIAPSIAPTLLMTPHSAGGFGVDAFGVAWFTAPMGICMVLGGLVAGSRTSRWGTRVPMLVGCLLLAAGAGCLAALPDQRWQMTVALALYGAGMGLSYAGQPNLIIQAVPQEEQGVSAAMGSIAQNLGTAAAVQAVFVVLALHPLTSAGSAASYSGSGYALAFAIGAATALISAFAVLLVPHGRKATKESRVLSPRESEPVG